jgi:AsmA protein
MAALIIVPLFIPWDKVKVQAEQKISEMTHHTVTIGSIGFNVFRGVEIRNLRVENARGFSQDPLISDEGAVVKYRLLPLLFGKVILKAVVLDKPRVTVERAADGRFNFSDMIPAKTAEMKAEEPKAAADESKASGAVKIPLEVLISRAAINQASLTYRDLAKKQEYAIDDFNLKIDNITLTGLTPVTVLMDAKIKAMGSVIPFSLQADWRFSLAKELFTLDRAVVTLPGLKFQAQGTVEQVISNATLAITGDLNADFGLIMKELVPAEMAGKLPKDMALSGTGVITFKINGPAKSPEALQAEVTDQIKIQLQAMGLEVPISVDGGLGFKNAGLDLKEKMALPGLEANLAVQLADVLKTKVLACTLNANLDLGVAASKMVPPSQAAKLSDLKAGGTVQVNAKINGPLSQMDKVAINGQVQAKAVSVNFQKRSILEGVTALLTLAPDRVALTSLSGKLAGQPIKASFSAAGFDLRKSETLKPAHLKAKVQWAFESPMLDGDALMALMSKSKEEAKAAQQPEPAAVTGPEAPEPVASELMPAGLEVQGQAKLGGLHYSKVKLGALVYGMTIKQRVLRNSVSLKGYDGLIQAQVPMDFTGKQLSYDVKADVKNVDVQPLMTDVLDTYAATKTKKPEIISELRDKLTGHLSGSMTLSGHGMRASVAKKNMKGQGAFTLLNGRIQKFAFQSQLAKLFGSQRLDQDIPFDHTVIEFTIADQLVNLTKFLLESGQSGEAGDIRMAANGGITFDASFKDFKMRPSLSPKASATLSPQFQQYSIVLKDEKGWVTIPVIMNGPMSKPDVQPDWNWIKQQFSDKLSKKAKGAAEEAGKKVQNFMQNEKGKSQEQMKQDAGKEVEKAKEQIKNLKLDNLFK